MLAGGWKNYRRWVRAGLESLPRTFSYRVLCGPTGCGKTRLLHELARQGHQVLELEGLARHRGSLLGDLPGIHQPTQKQFDSMLLETMRHFDVQRTVWVEAESKKIGNLQLPEALYEAMHHAPVVNLSAPMSERVKLWREDYPHFVADLVGMVQKLEPLKPLVGGDVIGNWHALAKAGDADALFESVMVEHYDPCYARSTRKNFGLRLGVDVVALESLASGHLAAAARGIAGSSGVA